MSVCAFVLTRDRKALLVECLRSLVEQADRVVVLDNASCDGTQETLAASGLLDRVDYHRSESNTGGAGGYKRGVELALESGAEWIWLMDDDAEPRPDALRRLLETREARDPSVVALATSVVHPDGTVDVLHRCDYGRVITPMATPYVGHPTVDCASFVGLLVRASAARAAGLPRAEFFLGYDDAEWSLRLRRDGGSIRLIPDAEMLHKIPVGGTSATWRSRFWNRVLGQAYESSPWASYWKDLYRVRNLVWLRTAHDRIGATEVVTLIGAYAVKTLLYDEKPLRRLPWLVRYALKGRRADFRAPTPGEWAGRSGR